MTTIRKADGSKETFVPEKLIRSLKRSGASERLSHDITAHIEGELSDGASTEDIYKHARALLVHAEKIPAARYSLRRALFNLGPTGFPFEDFLAKLFQSKGYTTKTGVMLRGTCVEHEVDLVAFNDEHCFIAEAKFHARPGTKSDLQVALYSHARFKDLEGKKFSPEQQCGIRDAYIITNTKFTTAAIEYAACVGLKLISWNEPDGDTLQDLIERAGIYPITALPSLSMRDKRILLEQGVILCTELSTKRDLMRNAGISHKKIETIISDAVNLCQSS